MDENKIFVGLDLSFTGTGIVILDKNKNIIFKELFSTNNSISYEARIIAINDKIMSILENYEKENYVNIYMEGLSFSSKGSSIAELGALHYFLRISFYNKEFEYKIIEPTKLKKFVTGKGNCKKNLILLQVYKNWGIEFDDDNLADAYSLARMGFEQK